MRILFIDGAQKSLHYNNKKIMLTEKEFLMLELLLSKRKSNNIPIDDIITHVWSGRESTIVKGNVSQLAYRLRGKLSAIGDAIQIYISMNSGGRCKVHRDAITIITTDNGILCFLVKSLLNINKNSAI
ncbi:Uncharacterised protein [Yersinia aldovae]|uniref:winged helix-turn-helix domain-containing protein n=1 Tax=Yersinia aldovae TaxID=29483 RepID=UPI0005E0ACBE|nr:winged helix-turn-helix domain-containing protein [Yersinia aldovae]CNH72514.1 Uncharacterised protein [Yersinia aldovae]